MRDEGSIVQRNYHGRVTSQTLRVALQLATGALDAGAIVTAFILASLVTNSHSAWTALLGIVLSIYLGSALTMQAYSVDNVCRASLGFTEALKAIVFTIGIMFLIAYFVRSDQFLSRKRLLVTIALAAFLIMVVRVAWARIIRRFWRDHLLTQLIILDGVRTDIPKGFRPLDAERLDLKPGLRDPATLDRFAHLTRHVDRVIVACLPEARRDWAILLKGANLVGEILVDDVDEIGVIGLGRVDRHTTMMVSAGPLAWPQRVAKRAFDLSICLVALLALTPVLLLIAVAIKIDSRGPVLFRQRRVGRANAFFSILKFRSMHVDGADLDGHVSARRGDARVTRVGWFIRRTSLDELPQLFNVLGGSMSLVGPRPHALGSLAGEDLFWEVDERYWHRHVLKPGITGLAQVRGYRGATHHRDDLINRLQADLEYASDWHLWRDVIILFSTLNVVVHRNSY